MANGRPAKRSLGGEGGSGKRQPMYTKPVGNRGFTLVEIMLVVAMIGLLASIASPNYIRARANSQKSTCINNLRQIDGAKQQFALENGKTGSYNASSTDIAPYLGRAIGGSVDSIYCPLDGTKVFD